MVKETAHFAMFRIVASGQSGSGYPAILFIHGLDFRGSRINAASVASTSEAFGVAEDHAHIFVTRDDVHTRCVVTPHRGFGAELSISVIRAVRYI